MKEFFGWMRWVWSRQETWQKLWIVAMFFMGMGWSAEGTTQKILWAIPATIFLFYTFKWAIWDAFKSSWGKYREHRNKLLVSIKTSDSKE